MCYFCIHRKNMSLTNNVGTIGTLGLAGAIGVGIGIAGINTWVKLSEGLSEAEELQFPRPPPAPPAPPRDPPSPPVPFYPPSAPPPPPPDSRRKLEDAIDKDLKLSVGKIAAVTKASA